MVQQWLKKMQGDQALTNILFEAIAQLPEKIATLEDAVFGNVPAEIKFLAHTLKGVTGNLGMTEIFEKALTIEQEILKTDCDHETILTVFTDLKTLVASIPSAYFHKKPQVSAGKPVFASQFQVLVAEDNDMNQLLIEELLKGMSLSCDLAENGKVALEKLRQKHYDLLLLDMQMPVMDGEETLRHIRADAQLYDLYVIALTAHAMKGDAEKYTRLGCNDYLSKPIRKEQFRERIYQVLLKDVLSQAPSPSHPATPAPHPVSPADNQAPSPFTPEQLQTLEEIVQGLRENRGIFNPHQIVALAERLAQFPPVRGLQGITEQLYRIADTFDDRALEPIIQRVEALCYQPLPDPPQRGGSLPSPLERGQG